MEATEQQAWKLHGPISDSDGDSLFTSENPLDWTCEELKGRATALFFPLNDGEILVQEGTQRGLRASLSSRVSFIFVARQTFWWVCG